MIADLNDSCDVWSVREIFAQEPRSEHGDRDDGGHRTPDSRATPDHAADDPAAPEDNKLAFPLLASKNEEGG
jgi:hypothetical protein